MYEIDHDNLKTIVLSCFPLKCTYIKINQSIKFSLLDIEIHHYNLGLEPK